MAVALTVETVVVYFGFMLLVAYYKPRLRRELVQELSLASCSVSS